jgi:hypothetical protein
MSASKQKVCADSITRYPASIICFSPHPFALASDKLALSLLTTIHTFQVEMRLKSKSVQARRQNSSNIENAKTITSRTQIIIDFYPLLHNARMSSTARTMTYDPYTHAQSLARLLALKHCSLARSMLNPLSCNMYNWKEYPCLSVQVELILSSSN